MLNRTESTFRRGLLLVGVTFVVALLNQLIQLMNNVVRAFSG